MIQPSACVYFKEPQGVAKDVAVLLRGGGRGPGEGERGGVDCEDMEILGWSRGDCVCGGGGVVISHIIYTHTCAIFP